MQTPEFVPPQRVESGILSSIRRDIRERRWRKDAEADLRNAYGDDLPTAAISRRGLLTVGTGTVIGMLADRYVIRTNEHVVEEDRANHFALFKELVTTHTNLDSFYPGGTFGTAHPQLDSLFGVRTLTDRRTQNKKIFYDLALPTNAEQPVRRPGEVIPAIEVTIGKNIPDKQTTLQIDAHFRRPVVEPIVLVNFDARRPPDGVDLTDGEMLAHAAYVIADERFDTQRDTSGNGEDDLNGWVDWSGESLMSGLHVNGFERSFTETVTYPRVRRRITTTASVENTGDISYYAVVREL